MTNAIDLPVGAYKKEKSEGFECEKCHETVDLVYEVPEQQVDGKTILKNFCYSDYRQFWAERGYRV